MRRDIRSASAALFVVPFLLFSGGASAHTESVDDANDTPGVLDIRSASVRHNFDNRVVHHIQTFGDWSLRTLGEGSYFVVLIDNAGTRRTFERCAFAFRFRDRMRGSLTNCESNFITQLDVAKVDGGGVDIKIPPARLGNSYRWAAQSVYSASAGACRSRCVDSAPDAFPLPSHDVAAPVVKVSAPLLASDVGTSAAVGVDYSVSDTGGSGVESWVLRRRPQDGVSGWEDLRSGGTATVSSLQMNDLVEGTTYAVQINATDGQENLSLDRADVAVPWDDASSLLVAGYSGSWSTATVPAGSFAGSMHVASGENASLTLTVEVPADHRARVIWVAPGSGSWSGTLNVSGSTWNASRTVAAASLADLPRQRAVDLPLVARGYEASATITISVPPGGGAVPVDALAVVLTPRDESA